MAGDWSSWRYGAVNFPLTTSAANSLLRDADPALYYTLDYFASVITTYLEPRLLVEAARSPAITQITRAVKSVAPYDVTPYLQELQVQLPLLSITRTKGRFEDKTMGWLHRMGEWTLRYILPPLNAGQYERIAPLFNAIAMTLHNRVEELQDASYASNALVWQLAGIESIFLGEETYSRAELGGDLSFPCWTCKLDVKERLMALPGQLGVFAGADVAVDLASLTQPTVFDLADVAITYVDPTTIPGIVSLWVPDNAVVAVDGEHVASVPCSISPNVQTQATAANQPVLMRNALTDFAGNAKSVLRFDGSASFMTATVAALANDSSRTIVCLARVSNTAKRSALVAQTLAADTGAHTLAIEANTAGSAGGVFGIFTDASSYDSQAVVDTGWHVHALTITATTNGVTVASTTTYKVDNGAAQILTSKSGTGVWQGMSTATQIVLGAIPGIAATNAACDLGPVAVFSGSLTSAQLASAVTYCKQWGGLA